MPVWRNFLSNRITRLAKTRRGGHSKGMDMLTDILRLSGLSTTVTGHATFYGDWGVSVAPSAEMALHVPRVGQCWFRKDAQAQPMLIAQGDLLLATRGFAHSISDEPHRACEPLEDVLARMERRKAADQAQDLPQVHMLCAKYLVEVPGGAPMLGVLPDCIHLTADQIAAEPRLVAVLDLLDAEARLGGGGTGHVVSRLVDTLLVFVLRRWFDLYGASAGPGWFRALSTPGVNRAVGAIHADPARRWNVDALADIAGPSRPTFLRRFRDATGEAPMSYVTRWRMARAARALRDGGRDGAIDGGRTIETLAVSLGYDNGASFSKAFRKIMGTSPSAYRRAPQNAPQLSEEA